MYSQLKTLPNQMTMITRTKQITHPIKNQGSNLEGTIGSMRYLKRVGNYIIMKRNMILAFIAAIQARSNQFTHQSKVLEAQHLTLLKTQESDRFKMHDAETNEDIKKGKRKKTVSSTLMAAQAKRGKKHNVLYLQTTQGG